MKCSFFSELLSFAKDVLLQKIDCVFVLAIRGLLHVIKNFVCGVIFVFLITITESFSLESFLLNDIAMISLDVWVPNHGVVENMCSFSKSYL